MIFDTHAHYYDGAFDPDRDELLAPSPPWGWPWCSAPAAIWRSFPGLHRLGGKDSAIFTPPWASTRRTWRGPLDQLEPGADHVLPPQVRAIGERSVLDYYWVQDPQAQAFSRDFLTPSSPSRRLDPTVVRDRDAHQDCLDIVRAHPGCRGVFHCYSGSVEDAKGTAGSGLDALLYREHHLCQCPAWP